MTSSTPSKRSSTPKRAAPSGGRGFFRVLFEIGLLVAVLAAVAAYFVPPYLRKLIAVKPPAVGYTYHWKTLKQIWTQQEVDELLSMVEGFDEIPSTTKDQTYAIEEIGEAEPITKDGSCENHFLIPNKDATKCVLPGRFDVASHYLTFGGKAGLKEAYDDLVSRMLSFNKFFFDYDEGMRKLPSLKSLFNAKGYLENAAEVCDLGTPNPVLDPFQLGVIVQVPGQSVPMHLDAPYFWGASRFTLPIWLVVVMQFSGLWEQYRVHQVQGVAYIHDWDNKTLENGGGFFFYPGNLNGKAITIPAERSTGIVCDGAIQVHGTELFQPKGAPIVPLKRNHDNKIVYNKNEKLWRVLEDNKSIAQFRSSELRIALVWRARCFRDQAEKTRFHAQFKDLDQAFKVDEVIDRLLGDMVARGTLKSKTDAPKGVPLAQMLLREYLRYPGPDENVLFPFNYCALPALFPWTAPVVNLLCPTRA